MNRCCHVLVVEDDAAIRSLIRFLVEREKWTAEEVSDGTEALQKLRTENYDAIVLDLMLPSFSGEDVLAELRRSVPAVLCKIVVVTASPSVAQKIDRTGVGAVLVKPFDIDELIDAIRASTRAGS